VKDWEVVPVCLGRDGKVKSGGREKQVLGHLKGKGKKGDMESVLEEWNGLVWEQSERPADKHAVCEIPHDGYGLDVKVTEHFVAAPSTEETDYVGVDLCTQ
jgi:hypothetical protein